MGEEVKKISFGFSKIAKKTSIVPSKVGELKTDTNKVEFIDCLEGKSIKLKDPIKSENTVLVIPLKRESNNSCVNAEGSNHVMDIKIEAECNDRPILPSTENSQVSITDKHSVLVKNETLEEIAAREILQDLNKQTNEDEKHVYSVPLTSNAPSGEVESSLDDYENIPVSQFGLAMLRGMGWAPGKGIGKNEKLVTPSLPALRPKGMGLGADKVLKVAVEGGKSTDKDLKMVKGSFVRIIAGTHKDSYGQIEGFDDEFGRVIVKLALKNISVSLNEIMTQLVDKSEFTKNSKVINMGKYDQYKDDEKNKDPEHSNRGEKDRESNRPRPNENNISEQRFSESSRSNSHKRRSSTPERKKHLSRHDKPDSKSNVLDRERCDSRKVRLSPSRSRDQTSSSDSDYSDRKKKRIKKKKPSSHRHKSRTRSRSPKHHKKHKTRR